MSEKVDTKPKESLTSAFKLPFYVSAVIGFLPFSIPEYRRTRRLKWSLAANIWCCLNMVNLAINYHLAVSENYGEEAQKSKEKISKLKRLLSRLRTDSLDFLMDN